MKTTFNQRLKWSYRRGGWRKITQCFSLPASKAWDGFLGLWVSFIQILGAIVGFLRNLVLLVLMPFYHAGFQSDLCEKRMEEEGAVK